MIETDVLERTLAVALRTGGDFAEVFAEDRRSSSALLDDGKVEELTSGRDRGAGIRVVVGDTTLSEEECAQIGGVKQTGGAGWMSHAWVVPGCESPWGVFSAASPVLDDALGADNGGPHCAGSSVRDRYDMGDAPEADGQAVASSRTLGD